MSTPESKITPSSGAGAAAAPPNSTAAVVPVTVSPVLAGVAREAAALARAPVVSLWIADEKARSLKVGAVSGESAGSLSLATLTFGQGGVGWVAAARAPLEVDDVFADGRFTGRDWWRSHGLSSFLGLPVIVEDRLLGVLALNGTEPLRLTAGQREQLVLLTNHAANALLGTHLEAEAARRREEVAANRAALAARLRESAGLLAIARILGTTTDLTEALRLICRQLAALTGADTVAAYLLDRPRGEVRPVAGYHVPKLLVETLAASSVALEELRFGRVLFDDQRLVWTDDAPADPRFANGLFARFPHRSALMIPLVVNKEASGGFYLVWWEQRRQFEAEEVETLEAIGGQVGLLLHNARHLEALEHRVNTALRALAETNALRSAIFGSLYGQVAAIDRDGFIIAVNHSWRLFAEENGSDPARGASVGANYLDACRRAAASGVADAARALEAVTAVLAGETEGVRFESSWRSPAGERWFEVAVEPFWRPERGAVISYIDITRRRQAEEDARRQHEELAHAQRVTTLGELGASLAHEINQPLAAIVTNARAAIRLLEQGGVEHRDVSEALTDIAADAERASAIIGRLRALSRKEHIPRAGLNLNELIDEVVKMLGHDFVRKGISIHRAPDPALPAVCGDPIQLQQVVLNLLVNASEAIATIADGRREVAIATSHRSPGIVEIAVRDNGIGAKETELKQMFERFVSSKPGGLGMGLAVSRSIVEAHNGRIWAAANPDRGLTLYVELPCENGQARGPEPHEH